MELNKRGWPGDKVVSRIKKYHFHGIISFDRSRGFYVRLPFTQRYSFHKGDLIEMTVIKHRGWKRNKITQHDKVM